MAWEDYMNHSCDIYHLNTQSESLGYGIVNTHASSYPANASKTNVPCHFHIKSGSYQITQSEPLNEYYARVKISFPIDTDIKVNDKIVSRVTGFSYIAELPRKIQDHHIIVYAKREGTTKGAI